MRAATGAVHAAPRTIDVRMAAVLLLAVLGGLAALIDDAAPTGLGGVDGFWRFATGALVVGCAGFATPVAWVKSCRWPMAAAGCEEW